MSPVPICSDWDSRDTPWFWSLLHSYHSACSAILEDWTLRDKDNNPPPRSIWFDKEELDLWREDREEDRKRDRDV
jgi:hypothetical protein